MAGVAEVPALSPEALSSFGAPVQGQSVNQDGHFLEIASREHPNALLL
jgi:hypothetical protein